MVDLLIKNGIIVTMNPDREIINDGAVAIEKNRIVNVGSSKELEQKYNPEQVIDAQNKIVMPGLMDAHAHAGHSLLRTLGMHNNAWYKACEVIYSQASTEEFWEADALLSSLERLKFGVTCGVSFFGGGDSVMRVDDPVFAKIHCDAVARVGVRSFLAVGPRRSPYPRLYSRWFGSSRRDMMISFEDMISNCKKIIDENENKNDLIKIALMFPTPHPERKSFTSTEISDLKEQSASIAKISREKNMMLTMDGHARGTIKFCHETLNMLDKNSLLSHSTEITAEEIQICAENKIKIAHNPSAVASIMGRCPVPELLDAGVTVAIGSDAGAPDRSYDIFRHMFQAMRYHRRYYRDDRVLPPGKVLEMATIDAAKAFGIDHELGSIETGKKADMILIDTRKPHLYPMNMPVDRIVYFANGNDVDTVIINGKVVMKDRIVKTLDENEVLDKAQKEIENAVKRSGMKNLYELTEKYWGNSKY